MDAPTQLIRERLVDFPRDGVGRDGTLVWLLAYAERLLLTVHMTRSALLTTRLNSVSRLKSTVER